MEYPNHVIDTLLGLSIGAGGWFAKTLHSMIRQTEAEVAHHKEHAAQVFVAKDDYREDIRELKQDTKEVLTTLNAHIQSEDVNSKALIAALTAVIDRRRTNDGQG